MFEGPTLNSTNFDLICNISISIENVFSGNTNFGNHFNGPSNKNSSLSDTGLSAAREQLEAVRLQLSSLRLDIF